MQLQPVLTEVACETQSDNRFETVSAEILKQQLLEIDDDSPILVDFDETLWLSNSTEQFLESVQPSIFVSLILQILGLVKPWKWYRKNQNHYRDLIRVKVILTLFPWAVRTWKEQSKAAWEELKNDELIDLLNQKPNPKHIISYGFDFVLEPLLSAGDIRWPLTVCSTFENAIELRLAGKAEYAANKFPNKSIKGTVCITDSLLDRDLLSTCYQGWLVKWPEAKFCSAGMTPMLPLVYTKKVKRPDESYITRAIFGHDYLTLFLVFALASNAPLQASASLLFFILSYFSAYEIGYFENDRLGLRNETNPKISKEFRSFGHCFKPWFAWVSAILLALPGAWLAAHEVSWLTDAFENNGLTPTFTIWLVFIGFLVGVRIAFSWFNRLPEAGRTIPMLLLQLARTAGYLLIFSTSVVGALFCFSHGLSKWIPYVVYRFGGSRKGMPNHLFNFLMLITLLGIVATTGGLGIEELTSWHAIIIIGYAGARAAKDIMGFKSNLKLHSS